MRVWWASGEALTVILVGGRPPRRSCPVVLESLSATTMAHAQRIRGVLCAVPSSFQLHGYDWRDSWLPSRHVAAVGLAFFACLLLCPQPPCFADPRTSFLTNGSIPSAPSSSSGHRKACAVACSPARIPRARKAVSDRKRRGTSSTALRHRHPIMPPHGSRSTSFSTSQVFPHWIFFSLERPLSLAFGVSWLGKGEAIKGLRDLPIPVG
jgi:hypothetical protein